MPVILTIAGSDSGGGAGVQADLKAMLACGGTGVSVITALTAQNTLGVQAIHPIPAGFIAAQLQAVASDMPIAAVKTGMLGGSDSVRAVAAGCREFALPNLVVDPVLIATSGARLLEPDALDALKSELLPLAMLLTPNAREAEAILGWDRGTVTTPAQAVHAAQALRDLGADAVLIKGGHLDHGAESVDILADGEGLWTFRTPWLQTPHTHGTGCLYASAIATFLGRAAPLRDAIGGARAFLQGALGHGRPIGAGISPPDHGWALSPFAGPPVGAVPWNGPER